jgi:mannose-6-phosphate isomerase-like protein (cupin superfamily)
MSFFVGKKPMPLVQDGKTTSYSLIDETNGCVAGFKSGIAIYASREYLTPGVHDDQEGFIVLVGKGWAKVGDEEFPLEPEVSFIAPAGVPHAIKRDANSEFVKVCWFHGAIEK